VPSTARSKARSAAGVRIAGATMRARGGRTAGNPIFQIATRIKLAPSPLTSLIELTQLNRSLSM
jgi:hypothetical protein